MARTVKIEMVTPTKAKQILAKNTNNRNMSERSLNHYARQIESGQWEDNGDTICFREDGVLMDGQHRLEAIVKTNKSLECIMVYGLKKSAMATIDTGRVRKVADHLKLYGFKMHAHASVAAACVIIGQFKKGKYTEMRERQTAAEAIAYIKENPDFLEQANEVYSNVELSRLMTPSVLIATYYLFSKIDRRKAAEFFEKLRTGEHLGTTSPILKLRNQLTGMRTGTKRRGKLHKRTYLYYICAAFSAYLDNRRVDGTFKYMQNAVIELPKKGGK